MEVTGRQFQDLTNLTQSRRQNALHTLRQHGKSRKHQVWAHDHTLDAGLVHATDLQSKGGSSRRRSAAAPQTVLHCSAESVHSSSSEQQANASEHHSRRQHRRRVARIVADQWKWFTKDRKAASLAGRHHCHRLLLSGFLALQSHAKHQQLEWRRAAIFNHRRQYMLQGRCLLLWQAQLNNSKKLQQQLALAASVREKSQLQTSLLCWRQFTARKKAHRKENLQAKFYRSFVLLSSAVQQWKVAAQTVAEKRIKRESAASFWTQRQTSAVFRSWLEGVQIQQQTRLAKQQAADHHRAALLTALLQHWHGTTAENHSARLQGSAAMQVLTVYCRLSPRSMAQARHDKPLVCLLQPVLPVQHSKDADAQSAGCSMLVCPLDAKALKLTVRSMQSNITTKILAIATVCRVRQIAGCC